MVYLLLFAMPALAGLRAKDVSRVDGTPYYQPQQSAPALRPAYNPGYRPVVPTLDVEQPAQPKPAGLLLCPDGKYVKGDECHLCPDGSYSGSACVLAPDGSYR